MCAFCEWNIIIGRHDYRTEDHSCVRISKAIYWIPTLRQPICWYYKSIRSATFTIYTARRHRALRVRFFFLLQAPHNLWSSVFRMKLRTSNSEAITNYKVSFSLSHTRSMLQFSWLFLWLSWFKLKGKSQPFECNRNVWKGDTI